MKAPAAGHEPEAAAGTLLIAQAANIDGYTLIEWSEAANQTLIVLGHPEGTDSRILVNADFPTRFIDMTAKNHTHQMIDDACAENDIGSHDLDGRRTPKKDQVRAIMDFALGK